MENMDVNPSPFWPSAFWHQRNVFVTGHTGFKGGWLTHWLHALQAKVHGFALAPTGDVNLFDLSDVPSSLTSHKIGDIRQLDALRTRMMEVEPEIVFHLAAQSLVRESYQNPVDTYATNVMGTVNLLEAVRHVPSVKAVVIVTSDKCYENRETEWSYSEDEPMGGHDPYSNSKGCAELVVSAYRRSFFSEGKTSIASARAGNVIGGGDWAADRLLPDILNARDNGSHLEIRSPAAVRPWQHVMEPLAGYLTLAERLFSDGSGFSGGWNFGPNKEDATSVEWITNWIAQHYGPLAWSIGKTPQPHEAIYLDLSSTKSNQRLSWHSRWSLSDALTATIQWRDAFNKGAPMRAYTLDQIRRYCGLPTEGD